MQDAENRTSLKQAFQDMIPKDETLVEGVVTKESPLTVQLTNNDKMILTGNHLICPWHLTDYETKVSISGNLLAGSQTEVVANHSHGLETYVIEQAKMIVHNQLKTGEKVWLLRFGNGKQYFILDRQVV